ITSSLACTGRCSSASGPTRWTIRGLAAEPTTAGTRWARASPVDDYPMGHPVDGAAGTVNYSRSTSCFRDTTTMPHRPTYFLLSPAHCGGKRAGTLFRPSSPFELARRVREPEGAPIGEVFSYVSSLYFRGKMAYARRFGRSQTGCPEPLVITGGKGLLPASTRITLKDLTEFARVYIDETNPLYREPLTRDVEALHRNLPDDARVVLLGSIATSKYLDALVSILGPRLCYPKPFIGLGDMSRGALMLRAAADGVELGYVEAELTVDS